MRIIFITAGTGTMYCGACARDALLARGLIARGQEVMVVPLYLPLCLDDGEPLPQTGVHLGGLNIWLERQTRLFQYLPETIRKLLAAPILLRALSRAAVATRPGKLGPLTLSVLAGTQGPHAGETSRLLAELARLPRPDLVWLTNSLLSGLAPVVRERFGCRVVCGWQGEDSFIEALPEIYRNEAYDWMRRHAAAVDCFIAPGKAHAARMAALLRVPAERIRIIPTGVDTTRFQPAAMKNTGLTVLGYLSVITWRKGLDLLVDAFVEIARTRRIQLQVAGKVLERSYFRGICRRIRSAGLEESFRYWGEVDGAGKLLFLRSCDVLALPSRIEEARGLAALEALACGVPVVAPRCGAFTELLELTGGGALFQKGDSQHLTVVLKRLIEEPAELQRYRESAADGVVKHYSERQMAELALSLCSSLATTR